MEDEKKELPDLTELVKGRLNRRGHTLKKGSRSMGRPGNYLSRALRHGDMRTSQLLALSDMLGENMFVHYFDLLPTSCRSTPAEVALQDEIKALKAELERVKEERDRYWAVIEKRMG